MEKEIVDAAVWLEQNGLNQGTTGNVSIRCPDADGSTSMRSATSINRNFFLITPSGVPYRRLTAEMIVSMDLNDPNGHWQGQIKPSSEWRFHRDILNDRPEIKAVVHCHSTFATSLAVNRVNIPAFHYMVAAFGGNDIRCAPYARFGTDLLSGHAVEALRGRMGCLLANHGMIALGKTLEQACWYAQQLESLSSQFWHAKLFGSLSLLTDTEMAEASTAMKNYIV